MTILKKMQAPKKRNPKKIKKKIFQLQKKIGKKKSKKRSFDQTLDQIPCLFQTKKKKDKESETKKDAGSSKRCKKNI